MAKNTATKNKGLSAATGILLSMLIIVVIAGIAVGVIAAKVGKQDGIYEGVTVSGIDVGGMTRREAEQKLESQMGAVSENKNFNVIIGDYIYNVTAKDFNMQYDATAAAAKAYFYGREGTKLENIKDILKASSGGCDIPFSVTFNTDNIADLAQKIAAEVSQTSGKSSYEVTDECVIVTLGGDSVKVDPAVIEKAIIDRFNGVTEGDVEIEAEIEKDAGIDLEKIREEIEIEAEDAYVDSANGSDIIPEVIGRTIDVPAAKKLLEGTGEGPDGNVYRIEYLEVLPEITREDLKESTFDDLLSSITTYLNASNVNRTDNIRLACQKINGMILYPGDEFSFNKTVGERTYAAGFKDATIYLSGELADGVGGGICQVSSTIYDCAVGADLEITERHNHRYTVTYVKLGMDATVAYDSGTDFRFKNNSDYPIKISIVQESNYVKCDFLGTLTDENRDKTVTMEYTVNKTTSFGVSYKADPSVKVGSVVKKNGGYTGYDVVTYRVTKINGKEVSRVLENKSNYSKLDEMYLINPAEAKTDANGKVIYVKATNPEPTTPDEPVTPTTPDEPDEPDNPYIPDEPVTPTTPDEPDDPDSGGDLGPDWLL